MVEPVELGAFGQSRDALVGNSRGMQLIYKEIGRIASKPVNVLIRGETGTGKELIARAIYQHSDRAEAPFIAINCAAIPETLLESELFGHERGAFTGAIARRIGRFELAHQGTLLLDEIGDLPLDLQPKLLRVLEEREFQRIGGTQNIGSDVRIIAATNRPLEELVEEERFRADLYYRLNVFPIDLPPLRERTEDIPLLVRHFVTQHAEKLGRRIQYISPDVMETLIHHRWPGNVRELKHVLHRAVILSQGASLQLPPSQVPVRTAWSRPARGERFDDAVRQHLLEVLRETNGIVAGPRGAAARLGLKRTTLLSRMKKLGITPADSGRAIGAVSAV